mmetsp:Transcript_32617/g.84236  ORF Transcript_32617/g.84236 Transcript_32617/m.84236 type:complete len:306 (+) Transcript_32617:194-1111(+)
MGEQCTHVYFAHACFSPLSYIFGTKQSRTILVGINGAYTYISIAPHYHTTSLPSFYPTFHLLVLHLVVRPLNPGHESLHIGGLHGGTTPDAKAGGGISVCVDVVRDVLILEKLHHLLYLVGREIESEAHRGVRADRLVLCQKVHPVLLRHEVRDGGVVGLRAVDESGETAYLLGPTESIEVVFDDKHGGGVDDRALEDSLIELALLGEAEDLRQRAVGLELLESLHCAGREDDHTVSTLTSEHLLEGVGGDIEFVPWHVHGEHSRGGITDGEALSVLGDPVTVGHLHTRCGAVPGEDHIVGGRHL